MKTSRFFTGFAILLLGGGVSTLLFLTKPEAEKKTTELPPPIVYVKGITFESVRMNLPSQGTIEPRRKTTIAAEVGGRVDSVSDKFDAGGEFAGGEALLRIETADYEAAHAEAEAALKDAELTFATETARAEQALRDWKDLGRSDQPSPLTLREPQVASAKTRIKAAEAAVKKAERDLERTVVKAPFAGRIERIHTETGAYLLPGQMITDIYTTAPYEIRLPLSLDDWTFVQRDENGEPTGEVAIRARAGGKEYHWQGRIVRTEGQIERESRSVYLVAEIGRDGADPDALIQPGLFVQAGIAGKPVPDVARIAEEAFFNLKQIVVVDSKNKLRLRQVDVIRRSGDEVLISRESLGGEGIQEGDRLCLTELANMEELSDPDSEIEVRPEVIPEEGNALTGDPASKP